MKLLVAAAGAVGSLVGGLLAHRGWSVTMVARGEHGRVTAAEGLKIEHHWKDATWWQDVRPLVVTDVASAGEHGPFDATLIAVKSYHTVQIAAELAALSELTSIGQLVCMQNGVGNEERLGAAHPAWRIIPATLTMPAWLPTPGTVATTDKGGIGFGFDGDDAAARELILELAGALADGGKLVRLYPNQAEAMKWSKLLLNQLGAATSALLEWPPERVFADRRLFELELAAWRETLAVMRAKGIVPVGLPGYPVPLLAALVGRLPDGLLFPILRRRLATGRGTRLPGVATDLAAGRRDSEIVVLNGAVADAGRATGVPTPVSRALTGLVLAAARGELDRHELAGKPDALIARLL